MVPLSSWGGRVRLNGPAIKKNVFAASLRSVMERERPCTVCPLPLLPFDN